MRSCWATPTASSPRGSGWGCARRQARPIATWEVNGDHRRANRPRAPRTWCSTRPAGLHGWRFKEVLALADKVIVPLQPSIFDIYATRDFLDELMPNSATPARCRSASSACAWTPAPSPPTSCNEFIEGLGLPVLGYLRDTQNYVHLAARGLTLFDVAPSRVERDLEQWQADLPVAGPLSAGFRLGASR
jgi:chromosome partitioning protein